MYEAFQNYADDDDYHDDKGELSQHTNSNISVLIMVQILQALTKNAHVIFPCPLGLRYYSI